MNTDLHWRVHITARDGCYEYVITESQCHPGTFQLRVADAQTNATKHGANTFATVEAAQDAATRWAVAHGTAKAGER